MYGVDYITFYEMILLYLLSIYTNLMKSKNICIVHPQRFTVELEASKDLVQASAILQHLSKCGVLLEAESTMVLFSASFGGSNEWQFKREQQLVNDNTYYLSNPEATVSITKFLNQSLPESQKQIFTPESEKNEYKSAITKQGSNISEMSSTFKDQTIVEEASSKKRSSKVVDKEEQGQNQQQFQLAASLQNSPAKRDTMSQNGEQFGYIQQSKSQIIKPIARTEESPQEACNFSLKIQKKSAINISKLLAYSHHRPLKSLSQNQQGQKVKITYNLNGKIIKEVQVKKMSIVQDEQMDNLYDLFLDEELQQSLKKKVTIAFRDKVIYCRLKHQAIVADQIFVSTEFEKQQSLEQTNAKKIFKIHKKRPIVKVKGDDTQHKVSGSDCPPPNNHVQDSAESQPLFKIRKPVVRNPQAQPSH